MARDETATEEQWQALSWSFYPTPKDAAAFERIYREEHTPRSPAPFARVAELHFPSLPALQAAASSEPAKRAVEHAAFLLSAGGELPHRGRTCGWTAASCARPDHARRFSNQWSA